MNDIPASLGAGAPMVRFADVSKRYGDLTVLDRLELDVAANEMVSIIGPSGSGKTTVASPADDAGGSLRTASSTSRASR